MNSRAEHCGPWAPLAYQGQGLVATQVCSGCGHRAEGPSLSALQREVVTGRASRNPGFMVIKDPEGSKAPE